MKLDLMNMINKAVEEVSEKAELVKQNASAGWDKASEYAKDVVNNAAIATKDVAVKANEGLNAGIETVGEKIQ